MIVVRSGGPGGVPLGEKMSEWLLSKVVVRVVVALGYNFSGGCCQGSGPGGVAPGEKMSGVVVVKSDGPGGGALGE